MLFFDYSEEIYNLIQFLEKLTKENVLDNEIRKKALELKAKAELDLDKILDIDL